MKKKLILLLTSLSAVLVSLSVLFSTSISGFASRAEDKPGTLSCSYYFDSSYTSIYELDESILDSSSIEGYKSWGTISCVYHNNSETTSYFVQSTDSLGRKAGILLYNCQNQELEEGNVITFTGGNGALYYKHPQIQGASAVKDYDENPSPIICRDVTYADFRYSDSSEKREKIIGGSTLVKANNVTVFDIGTQNAKIKFDGDDNKIVNVFYGGFTGRDDVAAVLNNNSESALDIMGHICIYNNDLRLYIRKADYVSVSPTTDGLVSISATCEHGEYETYETPDISDFIVTAYYGDGTHEQVFLASIDSWDYVEKYVRISYTEDGITKYCDVPITVHEEEKYIISIEASNPKTSYVMGENFSKPQLAITYNTGVEYISSGYTCSTFDNEELGRQTITMTYQEYETSYDVLVRSTGNDFETFDLNSNTFTLGDKVYNTGNYGGCDMIGYYRMNYGSLASTYDLLPYEEINDAGIQIDPQPGAIYADRPFEDIKSITLKFTTGNTGDSLLPSISFGENSYTDIGTVPFGYSAQRQVFTAEPIDHNVNYFKIESGDAILTILDLYIEYYNTSTEHGSSVVIDTNYTDYRVNPNSYSETIIDGTTSVSVPVDVTIDTLNNTYTVNEFKTYTYYSFEYAELNPSMASQIALIDPVDVANYYNIFGVAPANYVYKNDLNACKAVFGSDARLLQKFTGHSGYSRSVPCNYAAPEYTDAVYYEFDISLSTEYNTGSNRGVGRVVAFQYGFYSSYGYNDSPVCLFTDDHYSTFQEFNNLGGWGHRFDVQLGIVCRQWKQATIVS